jgi:endoglucanase
MTNMRRVSSLFLAFIASSASGCLTTPASETGFSKLVRQEVPGSCSSDALIEDMEDGDNRTLVREGRGGYWYTSVDAEGSSIEPAGNFKMDAPGHAGSSHAAHMKGKLAASGYSVYASMAFGLADPSGPYDASRYTGVTFWAKGPAHIRFKMPDAYTAPGGGNCKDCYNDFGIELALTSQWERYTIPFAWLAQQSGWGDPRPEVAANALYGMQWQFGTRGRSFDVWVDDIAFYCGNQSSAP